MNLKSRITKLEIAASDIEGICECSRPNVEIFMTKEQADGTFGEPRRCYDPIPNICDRCLRPIEKEELIIRFVMSKTKPPDGAVTDRQNV
jgi:hypothetical protein